MANKRVDMPLMAFPTTGEIVPEPLGLVLIFSSWNFPVGLALEPLIGAISAGNTSVLKPSELAPASSSLLTILVPFYLDNKAVMVIEGGAPVAQRLLDIRWDKIFFTGSPRIGRIIMSSAVKHLTPVTLELGGKCPAIVDTLTSSKDREVVAKRIIGGKWVPCNGQGCIAIDYLLVEEKFATAMVDLLKSTLKRFYGENPRESNSLSRIVNKQHFMRLKGLLNDPGVAASIAHGGVVDDDKLYIEPTIMVDPPLDAEIMIEEIFGPLLPIITLKKIEDSIGFINSKPKALAVYIFTRDETLKKRVISETSSGSVTVNDAVIQYVCDTLPFGGIGQSGFGRYHGKFSFDTFSHEKAVMRRPFLDFNFRYPPWNNNKLQFLRSVYNLDYFKLFLLFLGLKK
ncbi:aldehyde dehydrogenase family 3 member F1-like isoform X2 [Tasmannia lanceolata]